MGTLASFEMMQEHRTTTTWGFIRWATVVLIVSHVLTASCGAESPQLSIETSNPKLERAFQWASAKALSYVQTGKTGVVDGHERQLLRIFL